MSPSEDGEGPSGGVRGGMMSGWCQWQWRSLTCGAGRPGIEWAKAWTLVASSGKWKQQHLPNEELMKTELI